MKVLKRKNRFQSCGKYVSDMICRFHSCGKYISDMICPFANCGEAFPTGFAFSQTAERHFRQDSPFCKPRRGISDRIRLFANRGETFPTGFVLPQSKDTLLTKNTVKYKA